MTARTKAVHDWGYRSGLMLTAAQVESLLASLDLLALAHPVTAEATTRKPEHDQRGWQPK